MKKDTRPAPASTLPQTPQPDEEQVRRRAYELYEARGREDGHELDDWLEAEAQVTHTQAKATAA